MDRQEAVQKLATAGRLSIAHAEDLYDSFFEKPVVPQCVADWYEGNKRNLDLNLCSLVFDLSGFSMLSVREELRLWVNDNKKTFVTTLVNMRQFGYEVEKEPKYMVKVKGVSEINRYLNKEDGKEFLFSDSGETGGYQTKFTRKELEANGFGWVFNCEGVEVREVK